MAKQAFKQNARWCLHKTNIITFNHCQARSNSTICTVPVVVSLDPKLKGAGIAFLHLGVSFVHGQ